MNTSFPTGLINAICTPFCSNSQIDEGAFVAHLQWLEENGRPNLLVAGTTGEFFSLSLPEKKQLLRLAAKHYKGDIMFHAGTCALCDTIELATFAQEEGAHCVAAILPFYLASLEEDGLIGYLNQISHSTSLPFVIYNFPKHTQVRISPSILAKVTHFGIKDSSGDMSLIPHTPNYYIGSDRKMLEAYQKGAAGFISARSNAYPKLYTEIDMAITQKRFQAAQQMLPQIEAVCDKLSGPRQISLVKREIAQHIPGYPNNVRLPLL